MHRSIEVISLRTIFNLTKKYDDLKLFDLVKRAEKNLTLTHYISLALNVEFQVMHI